MKIVMKTSIAINGKREWFPLTAKLMWGGRVLVSMYLPKSKTKVLSSWGYIYGGYDCPVELHEYNRYYRIDVVVKGTFDCPREACVAALHRMVRIYYKHF